MQVKHLPQVAQPRPRAQVLPAAAVAAQDAAASRSSSSRPSLSSDGKLHRVHLAGQLPARRGLPRPLARRRRDRASGSSGWCRRRRRSGLRGAAPALFAERVLAGRASSLAFTAQREGRDVLYLSTSSSGKTISGFDVPPRGGHVAQLEPGRQADRRSAARAAASPTCTSSTTRRPQPAPPDERPERRHAAAVVARRQARSRSRPTRRPTDFDMLRLGDWQVAALRLPHRAASRCSPDRAGRT